MSDTFDLLKLLKPLFDACNVPMEPASKVSLDLLRSRAAERRVSHAVTDQLVDFYSIVDGVPCLNSLDIHRCADLILFEWWDQQELWLGQKDFQTFRWSASKQRFCIGSVGNVSFSEADEYSTFVEALRYLIERDHASG